jgi:hypothetical protein
MHVASSIVVRSYIVAALMKANAAPFAPSRSGGGRTYVCLSSNDKAFVKAVYLGRDKADGMILGKAEAFVASLRADGINCYVNGQ